MSRIIGATAAVVLTVAAIAIWSKFVHVEPETAATVMEAAAVERPPMISPFEIMIKHGKNLPVQEWRDAF